MIDAIVILTGTASDAAALEAAHSIVTRVGGSIDALHVTPGPLTIAMEAAIGQFRSAKGNVERIHALQHDAALRAVEARAAFDAFTGGGTSGIAYRYSCVEGDPVNAAAAAARLHDLVVVARAPRESRHGLEWLADVLVACGRPMLIAPDGPMPAIGETIAVAWKDTAEAARAVTAAMPFLTHANKIIVLTQAEGAGNAENARSVAEPLAEMLRRHGPSVEAVGLPPGERASGGIVAKAQELGADVLVSGAYSHSRMRQTVFGGFTRALLAACPLPLILVH